MHTYNSTESNARITQKVKELLISTMVLKKTKNNNTDMWQDRIHLCDYNITSIIY